MRYGKIKGHAGTSANDLVPASSPLIHHHSSYLLKRSTQSSRTEEGVEYAITGVAN